MPDSSRRVGLTRLEVIVCAALVGGVVVLLQPAVRRPDAAEQACADNLKAIGVGFQAYLDDHDGLRPPRLQRLVPHYLPDPRVLLCPADPYVADGGWGWVGFEIHSTPVEPWPHPCSYGYFFSRLTRHDTCWERLQECRDRPGYVVCVLHGKPYGPVNPLYRYHGRMQRLCFDGSVHRFRVGYFEGRLLPFCDYMTSESIHG